MGSNGDLGNVVCVYRSFVVFLLVFFLILILVEVEVHERRRLDYFIGYSISMMLCYDASSKYSLYRHFSDRIFFVATA